MSGPLRVERAGDAVWLTLERAAAAHALSTELVAGLRAAVQALRIDREARAVIVTATGDKVFCAGADLKERRGMSLDQTRAYLDELGGLLHDLETLPQPTIAAVNGAALGGGLELALACDLRLAVETATFALPEVRLGIIPGAGGTQRLPRLVGPSTAKEMIFTGERIDARRALELRLVSRVVPAAKLRDAAAELARSIGAAAPLAVAQAKRAVAAGWDKPMADALRVEREFYDLVLTSEDRDEGLRAFAEKRKPEWKGR